MTTAVGSVSAWAPLRVTAFRALWLAVLASNIGTWMQTVGAQWLLVGHSSAPTLVALVQTANTLPVLLFALPAGVLADTLDRRHLLIGVQLCVGALLTMLTATGSMPPSLLLTLTFVLGAGQALTIPAYQALSPSSYRASNCRPPPRSARSAPTWPARSARRSPACSSRTSGSPRCSASTR